MATRAATLGRARPALGDLPLLVSLIAIALGVGALATVDVFFAIAVVLGAGLVLLVSSNVAALPLFLVCTMFVESVALGPGLRIGRIAGGLALIFLAYHLLARGAGGLPPNALLIAAGPLRFWMLLSVF